MVFVAKSIVFDAKTIFFVAFTIVFGCLTPCSMSNTMHTSKTQRVASVLVQPEMEFVSL
jgi:hypothetical protein